MHSNKKILTSKNSPWLLCPSKRFPGMFYYFNGSTGETAWSLNDADARNPKKPTIVTDRTHAYPEPVEPPADNSNNTSSSEKHDHHTKAFPNELRNGFGNILNMKRSFNTTQNVSTETSSSHVSSGVNVIHTNLGHGSRLYDNVGNSKPMFGQAVFPKYVSRDPVPKLIWTLTPVLIPEQPTQNTMLDQITKYEPQEMYGVSNHFQNLSTNPFNTSVLQKNVPMFDQILAQRFKGETFDTTPKNKEVGCQTLPKGSVRTRSLSEFTPKTILKSSKYLDNLMEFSDDVSSSPNNPPNDPATNKKTLSVLEDNDLRFVLIAKRRQSVNSGDTPKSTKAPSKHKTPLDKVDSKKRVTFALDDLDSSTEDTQSNVILTPDSLEMECPEPSRNVPETGKTWYIAVDTSVLLAEFERIEHFVLSDKSCRLLIPKVVKLQIEALSKGDCIERQKIMTARQIMRKLATPTAHVVVQWKPDTANTCEEKSILKCCWYLLQESHVVLITDNKQLLDKAKIIDIECYTFDEFKVSIKPTETQDSFDLKKVKITVNNYEKPTQNLFQQTLKELNPFGFTERVDYPLRTLFEKQNEANRIVFGKKDENDKLINLTNTKMALKNVFNDIDHIDDNISRLEITKQMTKINQSSNKNIFDTEDDDYHDRLNNQNLNRAYQYLNKDTIKISGITKLNTVFDLDDELKRFYIKNNVMENRIKSKRDEWICRLTQIMEEALTEFLLKEKFKLKGIVPPWSLHEAVQVMGEKFKNQPKIKNILGSFSTHIINCSINGNLNQNMKPIDVIKLVGFSMILIQNLKETIDFIQFDEADDKLSELIKNIEDPKTDVELESLITPVLLRSDELESRAPMSYVNKQSEVIQYLKKHFTAMHDYEIEKEPKIVRTTGKDLNTLKITNNKSMTVENAEFQQTVEPKVIRNVTVIDAYEEKLKKLDMKELDYEDTIVRISPKNEFPENKMVFIPNKEETLKINDLSECSVIEESLSSTFYNECLLACPLMKAFMTELRRTFMHVYAFIAVSMQEYEDRELYEDKRADIIIKANMAHNYIMTTVDRLQSIIARESGNGPTLKDLLIHAGDYVEGDETMAKYKEIVTGYLEQAQILEDALKNLLALTHINSEMD